jgi:hypothetical protein
MASTPKKMLILEPQNQGRHAKSWNSPTKGLKENSKKIEKWKIINDQTSENCFKSFSLVLSIKNKEKTPSKGSVSNVNNIRQYLKQDSNLQGKSQVILNNSCLPFHHWDQR